MDSLQKKLPGYGYGYCMTFRRWTGSAWESSDAGIVSAYRPTKDAMLPVGANPFLAFVGEDAWYSPLSSENWYGNASSYSKTSFLYRRSSGDHREWVASQTGFIGGAGTVLGAVAQSSDATFAAFQAFDVLAIEVWRSENGATWTSTGSPGTSESATETIKLAAGGGTVACAWLEKTASGARKLHCSSLSGGAWASLGSPIDVGNSSKLFKLVVGSDGVPLLLYKNAASAYIEVARWYGTGWKVIGQGNEPPASVSPANPDFDLCLNADNRPYYLRGCEFSRNNWIYYRDDLKAFEATHTHDSTGL